MAFILETSWTQSAHPELDAPARPLAPGHPDLRRWRVVVALRFRERATDRAVGQNAGELIRSEPIPQLEGGERRTWEHNAGRDLGQRHQGERAGLEQRMGDLEPGLFHHPAAVQQEVEVDLARSPALAADPSHALLDGLEPLQRRARRQQRADLRHGIQVAWLGRPDGLALVGQRNLPEREPGLPRQQPDGRRQVREPVAEIGAEADERLVHGTASRRNRSSIACARSRAGSGQLSPPWWACACSPGPKLAAGIPTRASCATSVQACLASIGAAVTARNSCRSGLSRMAGPAGARSVTAAVAPKRCARAITSRSASSTVLPGAKRKFKLRSQRAGTTLRPVNPSIRVALITSR